MHANDIKITRRKLLCGFLLAHAISSFFVLEKQTEHWLFWVVLSVPPGLFALVYYFGKRFVAGRQRLDERNLPQLGEFVLFLRSFKDDQEFTLRVDYQAKGLWHEASLLVRAIVLGDKIDFEEGIVRCIVSPVISIGSPRAKFSLLGEIGSRRVFLDCDKDMHWREKVVNLLVTSKLNVFLLGDSRNFHWEFNKAIEIGALLVSILVFPPTHQGALQRRWNRLLMSIPEGYAHCFPDKLPPNVLCVLFSVTGHARFVRTKQAVLKADNRLGSAQIYENVFLEALQIVKQRSEGVISDIEQDIIFEIQART